jgi:predicted ferric reductase
MAGKGSFAILQNENVLQTQGGMGLLWYYKRKFKDFILGLEWKASSKGVILLKKEFLMAMKYAYFDIGGVYNDPKGPIRHFTIASSPTENFIMISTRIRDTLYKKRLASLEEGAKVKVRRPEGKFVLHEDYSKPAVFLSGGIGVTPFRSMIKKCYR